LVHDDTFLVSDDNRDENRGMVIIHVHQLRDGDRYPMIEDCMDEKTYDSFCRIIYDKAGIALGSTKQALVHARLAKRLRALGMSNYDAYLNYLINDSSEDEIVQLLDVISTNTTSFFRETIHFTRLQSILKDWLKTGKRHFRIWCAAASTGEEPYTLSMVCQEALGGHRVDLRILATDISTNVLRQCKEGEYSVEKLSGVPPEYRNHWFEKTSDPLYVRASDSLRAPLVFARLNLMEVPYPMKGPFDIVFCRNVMIYFDREGRERFVKEAHRLLASGGYLFTGHSESLTGISSGLTAVEPSVYQK